MKNATVYDYIASSNPFLAKRICEELGYKVTNPNTMGENLAYIVDQQGESALYKIMEHHPDKEIILEMFGKNVEKPCQACQERSMIDNYLNANGNNNGHSQAKAVENNFSVLFLAGVTILAVAILKK